MSWLRSRLDKNDEETFSPQSQAPLLDPASPKPTLEFSPAIESPLLSDRSEIGQSIITATDAPHSQVLSQVQGKATEAVPIHSPVSPPKSSSTRVNNPSIRPTIPQTTPEAHSYSFGGFMQSGGHLNTVGGGTGNRSAAESTVKLPRSFSTELLPSPDDVYGQGTIADVVYEPFTGAPMARLGPPVKKDTLSSTVTTGASLGIPARSEDPTRQKMWDYLAHIRGLQAEIAAFHLAMDGAGIGTWGSVAPTSTTGGGKRLGSVGPGMGRAELERRTSVADPEDMFGNAGGEEGSAESRMAEEGKIRREAEKEKEAKLDAEFAQLNALFAGKREAMNQIMTKLRELSTLVRAYHEFDPLDPGGPSPSRGDTVDSAPLSHGHLVLAARELPPSAQPLSPYGSDPEPPSLHLDHSTGSANIQGQAGLSANVYAKSAKPRIAPILTTSPSSSLPVTPVLPSQSRSTAAVTQHLTAHTFSETASKVIPLASTSSPRGASRENPPGGLRGYIPATPGSGVGPTPLPAPLQMHLASQM